MSYPFSTFSEGVAGTIEASNQLYEVINGDSTDTIPTESGDIPSLRKALVDNFYFVSPVDWVVGADETVFNQLRTFTDGSIWYAPTAKTLSPVQMTADPYVDSNWTIFVARDTKMTQNYNTLDAAVASTTFFDGVVVNLKERTAGNGGGATWDVVLASTVTPDTFRIVQCTGIPTLALVLRTEGNLNPKQFGATGDGVTDDAAAIQAALDYAGTLGNATVELPNGQIYLFSSPLTVPSGVRFKGSGNRRGVGGIKSNIVGTPSINIGNGFYSSVEDLNIFHATPLTSGTGIQLIDNDGAGGTDPAQYFALKNVRIIGHNTGLRIANESTWVTCDDVIVEQCRGAAYSLTNANLTVFNRCISDLCDTAWFLEGTTKTILNACTSQTCMSTTSAAINILNCDNVEINHMWFERNEFHNIHVRGTSRMTRILEPLNQGAGFTSAIGRGIFVDGTASNTFIDGGWHGGNATEDITIGVGATNTFVLNPRSTTTLTYTDASGIAMFIGQEGIRYPLTPVPSSDPNTLDTYEEGTWTPAYSTTGTPLTSVTYDPITGGQYTKIGRVVHIQGVIRTDAVTVGAASGSVVISGLPFTSASSTGLTQNGASTIDLGFSVDFLGQNPSSSFISPSATTATLYYRDSSDGNTLALQPSDLDSGANKNYIYFSGTYLADS